MSKKQLDDLFDEYESDLIIESIDMTVPVLLTIRVPTKMIEKYVQITSGKQKKAVFFWKGMNLGARLLTTQNISDDSNLSNSRDYLKGAYVRFEKYKDRKDVVKMHIQQRIKRGLTFS